MALTVMTQISLQSLAKVRAVKGKNNSNLHKISKKQASKMSSKPVQGTWSGFSGFYSASLRKQCTGLSSRTKRGHTALLHTTFPCHFQTACITVGYVTKALPQHLLRKKPVMFLLCCSNVFISAAKCFWFQWFHWWTGLEFSSSS